MHALPGLPAGDPGLGDNVPEACAHIKTIEGRQMW